MCGEAGHRQLSLSFAERCPKNCAAIPIPRVLLSTKATATALCADVRIQALIHTLCAGPFGMGGVESPSWGGDTPESWIACPEASH